MAQMVVTHYCHHSGFHAPYPLWGKWWSNTIMMALVLIHDAQYGPDGGRTLLPSFWFPCTTPTMVQMVVKHHYDDFGSHTPYPIWPRWWSHTIAIILVSMHHTHYGSDGSQTPLPHFGSYTPFFTCPRWWSHTIAIILVSMHHTYYGSDGSQTPLPHFGSYTPFFTCPRWWSHTIAIILVSMHHTHYGANGGQTPL